MNSYKVKFCIVSLASIAISVSACVTTDPKDKASDVNSVVQSVRSDSASLRNFCASDISGMRGQITEVITSLARSGKLKTSAYDDIGNEAARTLATKHC